MKNAILEMMCLNDFNYVQSWVSYKDDFEKIFGGAFTYPLKKEDFERFFINESGKEKNRLCFLYLENSVPVGMINFTNIQWGLELGHLGMITIDPLQRSSGIGYSMFMMMLRKGFSELKFNKIDLYCIEENKRGYDFYTKKCKLVNEGLFDFRSIL